MTLWPIEHSSRRLEKQYSPGVSSPKTCAWQTTVSDYGRITDTAEATDLQRSQEGA